MYHVYIKYIYKREIVKQHMQHSFPHLLLLTVVVKYYAYFNYAVHNISTLKGICVYQTLCYFEIPYIHLLDKSGIARFIKPSTIRFEVKIHSIDKTKFALHYQ